MFSEKLQNYAQQKYDSRIKWMAHRQKVISEREAQNHSIRPPWMKHLLEEIQRKLESCTWEEQILMKFFYGTMPLRDLAEYEFEVFLDFVRHGILLYQTVEWCRRLPEEIFLNDVLYYRINSENIEACRPFFYGKLKGRIQAKTLEEAVLEINYWCAKQASYEASDLRTISPMGMYRAGAGRCGEESTFAVTAFRSVGIPARQVYAPWWAHCDDNHAWVEVYVNQTWHFLGACEPEERLDKGWFVNASSRALMVHARNFSDFGSAFSVSEHSGTGEDAYNGEWFQEGELPCYQNVTMRYAKTRELQITVLESDGSPAEHAWVSVEVLNGAQYQSIAALETDVEGKAALRIGLGTVHLWAVKEGRAGEALLNVETCSQARVEIGVCRMERPCAEPGPSGQCSAQGDTAIPQWSDIDFHAPKENLPESGNGIGKTEHFGLKETTLPSSDALTGSRAINRDRIRRAAMLRTERIEGYYQEELAEKYPGEQEILRLAAGNFSQLYQFLEQDANPDRKWLLHSLSPKDYKDARADILEEHLQYASVYRSVWMEEEAENSRAALSDEALQCDAGYQKKLGDREIYMKYILCPRIFFEELTCYRKELSAYFSEEEKELFRKNPKGIWDYIKSHIKYEERMDYRTIYSTPVSVLKLQSGTPVSQKILCTAICRTLGIPARISQPEQEVEIYKNGSFVKLTGTAPEPCGKNPVSQAMLTLRREKEEEWNYSQNWTIARFGQGQFTTLDYQDVEFEGMELKLELEPGYYRILTATRLPNGNQLAAECRIFLNKGQNLELPLKMRTGRLEELLMCSHFKDFEVLADGKRMPVSAWMKGDVHILAFLEPGEEPTEHVLNEILQQQESFRRMGVKIWFLLREGNVRKTAAWDKAIAALPKARIFQASFEDVVEPLARSMYTDPEKLPLLVIVNPGLQGVYACSGYRVGSVKLMLELLKVNRSRWQEL